MKNFLAHIPTALFSIFFVISISSCDVIDFKWHRYQNQNSEIFGKRKSEFNVLSHGWKIIEKHEGNSTNYEWGWELTLSLEKTKTDKEYMLGINKIQYALYDKDNFELVKVNLNSDEKFVFENDPKKGLYMIEAGTTKTFRQTNLIPKQKAKRAQYGICQIILENY